MYMYIPRAADAEAPHSADASPPPPSDSTVPAVESTGVEDVVLCVEGTVGVAVVGDC